MFIELAEYLLCDGDHTENFLVLCPDEMKQRAVVRGVLGCPICQQEFPIVDGVAEFGTPLKVPVPESLPVDPAALHAFLGLESGGGYVILLGQAAAAAPDLAMLLDGVHFVGVNAPPEVAESVTLSLVRSSERIPLRSSMARGVVVGQDHLGDAWLQEAIRVQLRGLRLVVLGSCTAVPGATELASAPGCWVGTKD